jgi:hypothetical protein
MRSPMPPVSLDIRPVLIVACSSVCYTRQQGVISLILYLKFSQLRIRISAVGNSCFASTTSFGPQVYSEVGRSVTISLRDILFVGSGLTTQLVQHHATSGAMSCLELYHPRRSHASLKSIVSSDIFKSKMVWCTYCGQEFSRAEHLDRHVMTRTYIPRPFYFADRNLLILRAQIPMSSHSSVRLVIFHSKDGKPPVLMYLNPD